MSTTVGFSEMQVVATAVNEESFTTAAERLDRQGAGKRHRAAH